MNQEWGRSVLNLKIGRWTEVRNFRLDGEKAESTWDTIKTVLHRYKKPDIVLGEDCLNQTLTKLVSLLPRVVSGEPDAFGWLDGRADCVGRHFNNWYYRAFKGDPVESDVPGQDNVLWVAKDLITYLYATDGAVFLEVSPVFRGFDEEWSERVARQYDLFSQSFKPVAKIMLKEPILEHG